MTGLMGSAEQQRHTFASPSPRVEGGMEPGRHTVAIVGGGPIGLAMALYLAREGISSVLLDADDAVCSGSRAIGVARRSLELLDALGVVEPFLAKGLRRLGSRAFCGDIELGFRPLVPVETNRLPPMINLQQSYVEAFLVDALDDLPESQIRWSSQVTTMDRTEDGVRLGVTGPGFTYSLDADWVIACDGANSTVRKLCDLRLEGSAYADTYIIADVRMRSDHASERRIWFDPKSNPGSTVIMHKQPDDVWRIDFRLRADTDLAEMLSRESVLQRVAMHLNFIGETAEWEPEWISSYQARALTLPDYRLGNVFFAGDAAHLVPIFGARGMNSGLEDVNNLGWKLSRVIKGTASENLLESYSAERRAATLVNIASASMGAEFVAPQSWGAEIMREAVLSLLPGHPQLETLVDPRTSDPSSYVNSPLNFPSDHAFVGGVDVGAEMRDAPVVIEVEGQPSPAWLAALFPRLLTVLYFAGNDGVDPDLVEALTTLAQRGTAVLTISRGQLLQSAVGMVVQDAAGVAHALYGARSGTVYVVRPDQFVLARWHEARAGDVLEAVASVDRQAQLTTPDGPQTMSAAANK